ncbi:uncharacterized protein N7484_002523 [Penicillium longicatenatum]|uniref:uncharacterized protein n=1 Tax=Penicillium longicatenatum TaxID=1561947 RepID=UPI002547B5D1|nr:uncharacterized protein N7484_002523 [Penicillium longicatenatum]KAJ5648800.1 hypothetical protein N7484_002523 [Penicillium longicatenatum]
MICSPISSLAFNQCGQIAPIHSVVGTFSNHVDAVQLVHELLTSSSPPKTDTDTLFDVVSKACSQTAWNNVFIFKSMHQDDFRPPKFAFRSAIALCEFNRPVESPRNSEDERVAIVGFSGRFPSAQDAEEFWEVLRDGRDVHKQIPPDRFDANTHYDPTGKIRNTMKTQFGCFLDEPGLFDNKFFHVSPREAMQMDPVQRLGLITAYEAIEMAGIVAGRTPSTANDRIGTFYGQASDDWREINSSQNIDTYFIPGGIRAFTPGRINYHFKFSGPSYSVDTACSSSFAAIQVACTSLSNGECDTAIAGGVNILTNPDIFTGLSRGHFLSTTGQCKAFDEAADGYCRAEGVASLVLKRLPDAIADNDHVYGVILGSRTNHSAQATSITRPHHEAQAFLCQKILDSAGVHAHEVEYIEMHGTGTQAGDYHEMLSVTQVFAPLDAPVRPKPLYVGTVKANFGHAEAAAGVMSLVKVLKMLQHEAIPPHVGIQSGVMNKRFPSDLAERNIRIPKGQIPWQRRSDGGYRLAFLNNFSAAGGNTAMLLQEAPRITRGLQVDPRKTLVLQVTGKTLSSLQASLLKLADYMAHNPQTRLSDLSYTTTARRMSHSHRFAIAGSDMADLQDGLRQAATQNFKPVQAGKLAFVFSGQGKQYRELGKGLFETSTFFRQRIHFLHEMALSLGFESFLGMIVGSSPQNEIGSPVSTQLCMVTFQMAISDLLFSWGLKPDAVIGHSLGEYPALYAAGVISPEEVLRATGTRAQLIVKHCQKDTHIMLAIKGANASKIRAIIDQGDGVSVACENSADETVLAGPREKVDEISRLLKNQGFRTKILDVPYAFHSDQMNPIVDEFENAVSQLVDFAPPKVKYISSVLGRLSQESDFKPSYFARHMRNTVKFHEAIISAKQDLVIDDKTAWIEVGNHSICCGLLKAILGPEHNALPSLKEGEDAWHTLSTTLARLSNEGFNIDWNEYHREFEKRNELLELPAYSFDLNNYWIAYENDWALTKGGPTVKSLTGQPEPDLYTLTVHKIMREKQDHDKITLVARTDLSHPRLRELIFGHLVNGAGLCPSVLYAEICMTLAERFRRQNHADVEPIGINISSMSVPKPVILHTDPQIPQNLEIIAVKDGNQIRVQFKSSEGAVIHATCIVKYGSRRKWAQKWNRKAPLVLEAIKRLEDPMNSSIHRIQSRLAYRLFASLVDYGNTYRGMDQVYVDSGKFEGVAQISFKTPKEEARDFYMDPRWIDNLCHISGFIVNSNEFNSDKDVYISHGWESLRFAEPIEHAKAYRTYVRMERSGEGDIREGDVYIIYDERIVGLASGVKFQCVPRRVLDFLLPASSKIAPKLGPLQKKNDSLVEAIRPDLSSTSRGHAFEDTGFLDKCLNIVANECGVKLTTLNEGIPFADLGIDSLLSLTITSRLREELGVDLDSNFLLDIEDLAQLRELIGAPSTSNSSTKGADTPSQEKNSESCMQPQLTFHSSHTSGAIEWIRGVIAQELGVDATTIKDDTHLNDMGLDSLSILSITAAIRENFEDIEISEDLMAHCGSICELLRALKIVQTVEPVSNPPSTLASVLNSPSYLLQGNPKRSSETIFFFPDGSGSATSYAPIPPISDQVCVYSLGCPYLKTPEDWMCGIPGVVTIYLNEVRRRQPKGPYNLGGWSAGGVLAYEAAVQLRAAGEVVNKLILIDSPCPVALEPIPSKLFRFFDSIHVLGDRGPGRKESPPYLIPHFEAMIRNLDTYRPEKLRGDSVKMLTVLFIWARQGVCQNPDDPRPIRGQGDPKVMDWLLDERKNFGQNGWDQLLDQASFCFEVIDANHFSMMIKPVVDEVGRVIAKAF